MLYCNIYFLSFAAMRLVYQRLRGQCCSGAFLNKSHSAYDFMRKGMMKRGAESVKVLLFIVCRYGVIERLPGRA